MKKIIVTIAALSISTLTLQAQTEKGTKFIGGNFGFNSNNNSRNSENVSKNSSYSFNPKAGYFISNNFVLGANLGIVYTKTRYSPSQTENNIISFGAGSFLRHYLTITERFRFFSEIELSWITSKNEPTKNNENVIKQYARYNVYSANLRPGLAFFPTKNWAIEMSFPLFGYTRQTQKNIFKEVDRSSDYTIISDNFNFGLSTLSPLIGVNYHF
ncbi:hypothetical protein AQ505_20645 [Pedobacter sp. PACM 27299]|uniref:outer membrane beta-barrel protein n=1 Tax=Pedobacter sp. PACM 27299 TaxID=1727164 RepID=UPI000706E9BF|nr:outer membrane beta-barrel protein [Pedobacter sp. PACM 27299]ALL07687.1 hypothetical protein AQ505_20645 [Pedobacter sp. PACM 27299]